MIDGFDVRTLALTNLFLGFILGIGLLLYARDHPAFYGFRRIGTGYLLFAMGFLLLGLRQYASDWLSVIFANSLIIISMASIGSGILNFFDLSRKKIIYLSYFLLLVQIPSFIYFTFIEQDINWRIIVLSACISAQYLSISFTLHQVEKNNNHHFIRFLSYSFLLYGAVFIGRCFWTLTESNIENFMNANIVHALSLITFQLLIVISAFIICWSASLKLESNLALQATIDPLTQIYNRRALENIAANEISRAKRHHSFTSVVLVDIDFFKKINDVNGHQIGDETLKIFAKRIQNNLRQHDVLARFGGEEFILLLPDTNKDQALPIAEKLKVAISKQPFIVTSPESKTEIHLNITASFGVSTGHGNELSWQSLVSKADNALYQAKHEGRNQVKATSSSE